MDAEDYQPAKKEEEIATGEDFIAVADIYKGGDPFPGADVIDALDVPITESGLLGAAGQWAKRLRLNATENALLLANAKTVWELWGDVPRDALAEFKIRLQQIRRRTMIRQATDRLGGEVELAVAIIRCLGKRFGLTAESVAADLIAWFRGPEEENYMPNFAMNVLSNVPARNHPTRLVSVHRVNTALSMLLGLPRTTNCRLRM